MMTRTLTLLTLLLSLPASGPQALAQGCDTGALIAATEHFFEAMNGGDTAALRLLMHPDCTMAGSDGTVRIHPGSAFRSMLGRAQPGSLEERIGAVEARCDGRSGTTRMYYRFFLGDSLSHCGENYFQWLREGERWLVVSVTDSRRRQDCPPTDREVVAAVLDDWHRAAANADATAYFGAMSHDGIFLGTDASERWSRDSFATWATPFFERGRAWSFRPHDRHISFSDDGRTAWFDELLDTWMGPCRGSGVLSRSAEGWKIRQYNLAALVPNDKMQPYLRLLAGDDPAGLFMKSNIQKLRNARDYSLEVARMMPAEHYAHRPDTGVMSFAQQLVHLSYNLGWLSSGYLSEGDNSVRRSDAGLGDKDSVIAVVSRAYDYALHSLENMPKEALRDTVDFFAGPMSKMQVILLLQDHQTHHRGQLVMYLRSLGIKPPRYRGW